MQPDVSIPINTTTDTLPVSYSQWPLDMLLQREKELTAKIQVETMAVDRAESADVEALLKQHQWYQTAANILSLGSKIIGGAGPIALVVTTALSAPTFSNYVIAGITASAVPMFHFSQQLSATAVDYDRQARTAYQNDVLELQKVRNARKIQQQQQLTVTTAAKRMIIIKKSKKNDNAATVKNSNSP